jgi:molybdenum cofactor biosynthesis enzyme MoaA
MEKYITIVDYHQRRNNKQILFDKKIDKNIQCSNPKKTLVVNQFGLTYICRSPAWLPKSIGSILDYDNFLELLNSYEARQIRSEIELGRYSFCNNKICGFLNNNDVEIINSDEPAILLTEDQFTSNSIVTSLPTEICFDFDYTCNFKCPSCRIDIINHNTGPMSEINNRMVEKIKKLIIDRYIETNSPLTIRWAGGEPFVSHAYLNLWEYITSKKTQIKHIIQTNGSYLKKKKNLLEKMLPNISELRISFDAGTKETYEKIRVNGNWEDLLENCKFVIGLANKINTATKIKSDFVVQLDNYQEIPVYFALVKSLGIDENNIGIGRMWNWDTWDSVTFSEKNVYDKNHPEYSKLIKIINQTRGDR